MEIPVSWYIRYPFVKKQKIDNPENTEPFDECI